MKGKAWKSFMAKLYGFGAAVVIVGALFKIMHWPGAGIMLTIGLSVEAVIFFFSAFEPPHEEVDWSLVYPELAGMHGETVAEHHEEDKLEENKGTITEQLDNMLEEAKIGPELIASLGSGLRNLSEHTSKLNDISDASVATNEYVESVKSASKSVNNLSQTYHKATESITNSADDLSQSYAKASQSLGSLSISNQESDTYNEQMQKISKNLAALNAAYELELQGSNSHLNATNKMYDSMEELMKNLNASIDDTKKYKDEIKQLSNNLTALNTVYGNMLTAMNFNK